MILTQEITDFAQFEAWSGAIPTRETILRNRKGDEFMELLEEIFPDGCSETTLNDFLWFDDDYIFEMLGIEQD